MTSIWVSKQSKGMHQLNLRVRCVAVSHQCLQPQCLFGFTHKLHAVCTYANLSLRTQHVLHIAAEHECDNSKGRQHQKSTVHTQKIALYTLAVAQQLKAFMLMPGYPQ